MGEEGRRKYLPSTGYFLNAQNNQEIDLSIWVSHVGRKKPKCVGHCLLLSRHIIRKLGRKRRLDGILSGILPWGAGVPGMAWHAALQHFLLMSGLKKEARY